jgi:hypothetical protein
MQEVVEIAEETTQVDPDSDAHLSDDERATVREALERARRGEFAADEDVGRALLHAWG